MSSYSPEEMASESATQQSSGPFSVIQAHQQQSCIHRALFLRWKRVPVQSDIGGWRKDSKQIQESCLLEPKLTHDGVRFKGAPVHHREERACRGRRARACAGERSDGL